MTIVFDNSQAFTNNHIIPTVYSKSEDQKGLQEEFYQTQFLPYLRQKAEEDDRFLSKFVQWCMGSCCLPYIAADDAKMKIKVEFDNGTDAL